MNKANFKAEVTRQFIVEQTVEIFNTKRYAGTSLSDLASATGLTKGSIYSNFINKEEVALAVFDYNCARLREMTSVLIDHAGSYLEKLMIYATVYRDIIYGERLKGGCSIMNTAIESDDTNPLLSIRAASAISNWENNINLLITSGVEVGEFHKSIDIEQSAKSL